MFRSSSKIAVCLAALLLFAAPALAYEPFNVSSYDVDITVDADRRHHVSETIALDFFGQSHGLLREIPLSSSQEPYKIENVSVEGESFALERGSNVLGIRIGSPYDYVYGPKTYRISYDLVYARDGDSENDIVYVTPIGTEWDVPIHGASVRLTLPTEAINGFDAYRGAYGGSERLEGVAADGATLSVTGVELAPREGLTLYVRLPEGTFASAPKSLAPAESLAAFAFALAALVLAALTAARWFGIGRDDPIVRTVEFYSPDDMNPAEVSYIVNRGVDNSAVSAMFFYWASKGYIKYHEGENGSFTLEKAAQMGEERPEYERKAFAALFKDGDSVTDREIGEGFYDEAQSVIVNAQVSFRGKRALERRKNAAASAMQLGLCLLPPLLYGLLALLREPADTGLFGLAGLVPPLIVYALTLGLVQRSVSGSRFFAAALIALAGGFGCYIASALMEARFFGGRLRCLVIVGAATLGALFAALIRRRTDYATGIIGRCLGFKDFLETAEKDKIESLVNENPSYFFDTLPFAFVLGVTDAWSRKFEGLIKEPPSWYYGYGYYPFTPMYFGNTVARASGGLNKVFAQRAVRNAGGGFGRSGGFGGGFSGGGFSGGGGGGGGGSAW